MNKRNTLIALALFWAVILAYNFGFLGGDKADGEARRMQKRSRQVAEAKDFPILKTEKLQRKIPAYKKVRKDIFTPFGSISPRANSAVKPLVAAPAPADKLEKLVSELSFIGFVQKAQTKTIFVGRGDDVLLVREGSSIAGLARVIEITERKMTLGDIYGASDRRFEIKLE